MEKKSRDMGQKVILDLSLEKKDYEKAKKEWLPNNSIFSTQNSYDYNSNIGGPCELCNKNMLYAYSVVNKINGKCLVVGQRCMKKFDNISKEDINSFKFDRVNELFDKLLMKIIDKGDNSSEKFISGLRIFYLKYNYLSPSQINSLYKKCSSYDIEYESKRSYIINKFIEENHKDSFDGLSLEEMKNIYPSLNDKAKRKAKEKFGNSTFNYLESKG